MGWISNPSSASAQHTGDLGQAPLLTCALVTWHQLPSFLSPLSKTGILIPTSQKWSWRRRRGVCKASTCQVHRVRKLQSQVSLRLSPPFRDVPNLFFRIPQPFFQPRLYVFRPSLSCQLVNSSTGSVFLTRTLELRTSFLEPVRTCPRPLFGLLRTVITNFSLSSRGVWLEEATATFVVLLVKSVSRFPRFGT